MTTRIKLRRDTAANWTENDPVLALGEPGLETDTRKIKYGDGTSTWTVLTYPAGGVEIGIDGQITIGDTTSTGASNSIAIGTDAGIDQSWSTVALGNNAGNSGQSPSGIAIGRSAGETDQGRSSIAIGRYAAADDQSEEAIAMGYYAGNTEQRYHAIAIGANAGRYYQSYSAVAIGNGAGNDHQGTVSVAIGSGAGNYEQGYEAVAVGAYAGNDQQQQHAVAVGYRAGNDSQGTAAVAVGEEAGELNQSFRAVAIGRWAGNEDQGQQAIAIGARTGYYDQGQYAVAIGRHAGEVGQGDYSIAIGQEAAQGRTPINADGYIEQDWVSGGTTGTDYMTLNSVTGVYVGMNIQGTGITNTVITSVNTGTNTIEFTPVTTDAAAGTYSFYGNQGEYAIAIGAYAGRSIQHNNSVIINASGEEVNSPGPGTVVIKTVRAVATNAGFYPCYYNPETGELVYVTGV